MPNAKKYTVYLLLIIVIGLNVKAQEQVDGFMPIKNFSSEEYRGLAQNWSIVEDKRGFIYVANLGGGLLEYDGTNWRKIPYTTSSFEVRSLAIDNDGLIYVGAVNDFGYLKPNSQGVLSYYSLINEDSTFSKDFGNIWNTYAFNKQIVFQSSNGLFQYENNELTKLAAPNTITNSFKVNNDLFISDINTGLYRYSNNQLVFLKGSEELIDHRLYALLPYDHNIFLGVIEKHGVYLFEYQPDINSVKWVKKNTDIDDFINNTQTYHSILLKNGFYSIGSFNGIGIIDKQGKLKQWNNKKAGAIDENVKYQYVDSRGDLWLALANGLSYLQISSPISYFNEAHHVDGTIESIAEFNGTLYIATSKGLYYLKKNDRSFNPNQFIKVDNMEASDTWIVEAFKTSTEHLLLAEKNLDVYEVDDHLKRGRSIFTDEPWSIYQMSIDDAYFLIGLENGIQILERKNKQWLSRGLIKGFNYRISDIILDEDKTLWLSAYKDGIIKTTELNLLANKPSYDTMFTDIGKLSGGPYIFELFNNKLLVGTSKGLYTYDRVSNEMILHDKLNNLLGDSLRYIHRMACDSDDKLWLITYIEHEDREEIGYFDYNQDSTMFWNPIPFLSNIKGQINAIYHDKNGITWLGGNEGLFKYDAKKQKNYQQAFNCHIRMVRLGEDSTLFYGTNYNEEGVVCNNQPAALKPLLNFRNNSLIFNYSALNINVDKATTYSYYLDGFDKKWSEWTIETKKEYTNLYEGEYNFRVKAKNAYGFESVEASYSFTIFPPWYRTWWAYILFGIASILLVYYIVKVYTRYLRKVIKEKTAEIVEQKDEIEKQKDEITASIKYAQRIQRAVVPTYERAAELLPEHFVLWRPRDIVSGDFWWMTEKNDLVIIVAADCTGHGVPGAFVSMLGVSFLNEIVNKMQDIQANEILNQLRDHVKNTMKQTGKEGEAKDGMDLALIVLDQKKNQIQYAGAYNPLYLIRSGELIEIKANRNPIGIYIKEAEFTNHEIDIISGDTLYIFSDGFVDQFGGEKGGKFKTKNFKELLLQIQHLPMLEQEMLLDKTVDDWRGEYEQVDDIIIVGIRM